MFHQHQLVKPHMDAVAEEIRQDRRKHATGRDSPSGPGAIRSMIARVLVLRLRRRLSVVGRDSAASWTGYRVLLKSDPRSLPRLMAHEALSDNIST